MHRDGYPPIAQTSWRRGGDTPTDAPPAHQGLGAGLDPGFIWQQLSEIQKSLGAIQATLQQHTSVIDKIDAKLSDKVDKLEDKLGGKLSKIEADVNEFKQIRHTAKVVAWLVGLAAAGVLAAAGFVAKEAWSVFKPHAITTATQSPNPPPPQRP